MYLIVGLGNPEEEYIKIKEKIYIYSNIEN